MTAPHIHSRTAGPSLRLVVHDFSGHPFQAQLARRLADRGAVVTHLYCSSFATPKGSVGESSGSSSVAISTRAPFNKYSARKRLVQELEYGWKSARAVRRIRPDLVISSNMPLIAALVFQVAMRLSRIPVVFWVQDVYSMAMANHLRARLGAVGGALGTVLTRIERWVVRSSAEVVVIAEDFLTTMDAWRVPRDRVTVIENWAPLEEVPRETRPNRWSTAHGIEDGDVVFVYAGTLGLKHEPSVLLALAEQYADDDRVKVFVASEGIGADWLRKRDTSAALTQLPFQPWEDVPFMLASADVLLVLLEADAGTFSVPSKVLTYHCAGRAILGAMPHENLASRNMERIGSGIVTDPGDHAAFLAAAKRLLDDPELRARMGAAAREYAETTFDIDAICDRFDAVVAAALDRSGRSPR